MTVHQLPTPTIPPVDWDAALLRMLERYPHTEPPAPMIAPDSTHAAVEQIMRDRDTKDPALVAKQARLLEIVRTDVMRTQQKTSSSQPESFMHPTR